jgi:hypothetical protein
MPSIEDLLTQLATAPPSEFTRERNVLVARLTRVGQAEAVARVKVVPRPTLPVWIVNRLAREDQTSLGRRRVKHEHEPARKRPRNVSGPPRSNRSRRCAERWRTLRVPVARAREDAKRAPEAVRAAEKNKRTAERALAPAERFGLTIDAGGRRGRATLCAAFTLDCRPRR